MQGPGDLLNRGFIVNRPAVQHAGDGGRTFIVTGQQRSGTSLVASVLQQAGLFIGAEVNDFVFEDEAMARVLAARDTDALRRIIGERNAAYRSWGFKLPALWHDLRPEQLALFNDPHLIVTFRDPVAMSVRTALSEFQESMPTLRDAVAEQSAMLAFIDRLSCPNLLLSYEKALLLPGDFIDAVMQFCVIPANPALRERLIGAVEPNRPRYIAGARRRYEGTVERIVGDHLHGWCRLSQSLVPVALEVVVDEVPRLRVVADVFRQDLLEAGIGEGRHGFLVALDALRAPPDAVIRIRVAGHGIEIDNSGKRLRQLASAS